MATAAEVKERLGRRVRGFCEARALRERMELIGDDGLATSSGPVSPLQLFLQVLCGVENTTYLLADHPDVVGECLAAMHRSNLEAYRLICEGPAPLVIDYEDTSSTVISPAYYRKYCASPIDEYADICHAAGKRFITHMCGRLAAFGPEIRQGRQDGVDSVCPPTTGDMWAHQARAAWGPEKTIIGGIEPPALQRMTADETRAYVEKVLDQMPTFAGFILSTGDATAHATPVANLRVVAEVVARYGWK